MELFELRKLLLEILDKKASFLGIQESAQGSYFCKTFDRVWQCSEYVSSSEYTFLEI